MSYSIESKDQIFVKGYTFLSFAKSIAKNLSSKNSRKIFDTVKKSKTDAIKTASKRAIQQLKQMMI